jgi:Mg-chelatase subunit ChlD
MRQGTHTCRSTKRMLLTAWLGFWACQPVAAETSIELILDASGSMNGQLASGETKLSAAKNAVAEVVEALNQDVRLAFRAYGHGSPRRDRDCNDTELLVPFGRTEDVGEQVLQASKQLSAQGYTPITKVIGLAADDLKEEPAPRTVILISDGKETCDGDPCVAAKKLADADADLVIHTIGLGVDAQARYQLECIARVARGRYQDADSAQALVATLSAATEEASAPVETVTITLAPRPEPGRLEITDPGFHVVLDAETEEQVGVVNRDHATIELPAGLYNVVFDNLIWKSVEVRPGETTTLTPARLRIERSQFHHLLDPETGEAVGTISNDTDEISFVPGVFDVSFGDALWRSVELREGETVVLDPATITIEGIPAGAWYSVIDADDNNVAGLRPGSTSALLPPGDYVVEIEERRVPVSLTEGKTLEIKLQ